MIRKLFGFLLPTIALAAPTQYQLLPDITLDSTNGWQFTQEYLSDYIASYDQSEYTSFAVYSKQSLVYADIFEDWFTGDYVLDVSSDQSYQGIDTLIVTASNSYGETYDTVLVDVKVNPAPPTKYYSISDISLSQGNYWNYTVYLNNYFSSIVAGSLTTFTVTSKNNRVQTDLYYDDWYEEYVIDLSGDTTNTGSDTLIVTASNAYGETRDTVVVQVVAAPLPSPPTKFNSISDITLNYNNGFDTYIYLPGYIDDYQDGQYTTYSAVSKKGLLIATVDYYELYLMKVGTQYGVDTVIVSASNSSGTTKDTIQVLVEKPSGPTRYDAIPNVQLMYGNGYAWGISDLYNYIDNYTYGEYTQYSISSKKGLATATIDSVWDDYYYEWTTMLTVKSDSNHLGIDTLIFKGSNSYGNTYDTIPVHILAKQAPIQYDTIPDKVLRYSNSYTSSFYVNNYIDSYTDSSTSVFSVSSKNGLVTANVAYGYLEISAVGDTFGADTLYLEAQNAYGVTCDTFVVSVLPKSAPARYSLIPDITLRVSNSYNAYEYLSDYISYYTDYSSTIYSATSKSGLVSLVLEDFYGGLDITWNSKSFGTDTVIITATNDYGSTYDTLLVHGIPASAPVRLDTIPDITLNLNNSFTYSLDYVEDYLDNNTDNSTSIYGVESKKSLVNAAIQNTYYSYKLNAIADGSKGGKDTLIISATNDYGTTYDTVIVTVAVPSAPAKLKEISGIALNEANGYTFEVTNISQYISPVSSGINTSYSFTSRNGLFSTDINPANGYSVMLSADSTVEGVDTLVIKGSNAYGQTELYLVVNIGKNAVRVQSTKSPIVLNLQQYLMQYQGAVALRDLKGQVQWQGNLPSQYGELQQRLQQNQGALILQTRDLQRMVQKLP